MIITIKQKSTGDIIWHEGVIEVEIGTEYIDYKLDKNVYGELTNGHARIDATKYEIVGVKQEEP